MKRRQWWRWREAKRAESKSAEARETKRAFLLLYVRVFAFFFNFQLYLLWQGKATCRAIKVCGVRHKHVRLVFWVVLLLVSEVKKCALHFQDASERASDELDEQLFRRELFELNIDRNSERWTKLWKVKELKNASKCQLGDLIESNRRRKSQNRKRKVLFFNHLSELGVAEGFYFPVRVWQGIVLLRKWKIVP